MLAAGIVLAACSPRPGPTSPATPPAPGSAADGGATIDAAIASGAAPSSSTGNVAQPGADNCAGPTECAECTARPLCRFCTGPRTCISAAAAELPGACGNEGLSLGHPSSCGSDPVVAARVHAREVESQRQSALNTTKGMTLSGAPIGARLERFSSIEFPTAAATCHAVVWRLADGAKPGNVLISLAFVTKRSQDVGQTGFNLESRVGSTGVKCSSLAGTVRFKLVDRWSYGPVTSGGAGGLSFEVFTRPRRADDPDDIGAPSAAGVGGGPTSPPAGRGGSVGVDCQDCTFPCESSKTACERDCFRSGMEAWQKTTCNNTCAQILRACLRGCPGCN